MKKKTIVITLVSIVTCIVVAFMVYTLHSKAYRNKCAEIEFAISDRGFTNFKITDSEFIPAFIEAGTYVCVMELNQPEHNLNNEMKSGYYTDIQEPKDNFTNLFDGMSDSLFYKDIVNENYLALKYYDGKQKTSDREIIEYYFYISETKVVAYILP